MRIEAVTIPAFMALALVGIMPAYSQQSSTSTDTPRIAQAGTTDSSGVSAMRLAGEEAVRQRLVDPQSAVFEWPFGFIEGRWQTILKSRFYDGELTCGLVNARNRFGGYTGKVYFVVVLKGGKVIYADVGNGRGRGRDFVSDSCARSTAALPSGTG